MTKQELILCLRNVFGSDFGEPYFLCSDLSIMCYDCCSTNTAKIFHQYELPLEQREHKWIIVERLFNYTEMEVCDECGTQIRCVGYPPLTLIQGGKK